MVRQLGRPSLLAASYSGNAAAAATAAIEEVEETLEGMLEELNRIGTSTTGGLHPCTSLPWALLCMLPCVCIIQIPAFLLPSRALA